MKKYIALLMITSVLAFIACTPESPTQVTDESINTGTLVLSKFVTVGNSLTAGFQSSGLCEDFQMKSYPYLIAQQMGQAANFEQPIIANPGIGSPAGMTPQSFNPTTGAITQDALTVNPLTLLSNALLSRPYDNLGIPGADLNDALNSYTSADNGNAFFDVVLRNPNFGNLNQIDQALGLSPTLMILWLGNNDVLGAALDGGDLTQITDPGVFQTRLTAILNHIRVVNEYKHGLIMANIPNVSDIPYVNTVDHVIFPVMPPFGDSSAVPAIFDNNFMPVDFSGGSNVYMPILTEETGVTHITLAGLVAYQNGYGIPDSTTFVNRLLAIGVPQATAVATVAQFKTTGIPLPGEYTITGTEETAMLAAVAGFNQIIAALATGYVAELYDANTMLNELNAGTISGFSGKFVYAAPGNTAFSLDGVHPNDAGYALIANGFIDVINSEFGQSLQKLDATDYLGQYTTSALPKINATVNNVRELFRNNN